MSLVLKRMLTDTVAIAAKSSRDDYGEPSFGSGTNYKARVSYEDKRVISKSVGHRKGEEIVTNITIMVEKAYTPNITDRITLPDSSAPGMISFKEILDQHNNTFYWELYLVG